MIYDVIVVGGGFAGVAAARECALSGRSVLVLEGRSRIGGRTWSAEWADTKIELGGAWVHWHQPHTFAELTRAGLGVQLGPEAERVSWYVDGERRRGTLAERNEIARRGWDAFVHGVDAALPLPHDPRHAIAELARFDRLTIADRVAELSLSGEERAVVSAELESLAHAPLDQAGAVSVLRWHALSGSSLELTQQTSGRLSIVGGTGALLHSIATAAQFELRTATAVAAVARRAGRVEVTSRDGEGFVARAAIIAVPLNALGAIDFTPELAGDKQRAIALGQASRGIKLMIHARGEPARQNSIRTGHPFGYLNTEELFDDGTQLLIGFGPDAERCDVSDTLALQCALDEMLPGYEALGSTAHDWLADEFSRGTWAIHRPGWYEHHHAAMQRPEGNVLLAGSDLANGWAGFIDGAIESGLRSGRWAAKLTG
ncbi:MAG: flavin monoamine oxidase family protein [Solirubrobacteraceae bacterium]